LLIRSIIRRKAGNKLYAYGFLTINIIGSLIVTIVLYHIMTMDNYLNH
jgi:fluoride ion exporter CrcB/FEX